MASEPYDDVSWELPAHYHLHGDRHRRSGSARRCRSRRSDRSTASRGQRRRAAGPVFLMKDTGQEGLLAARYRLAKFEIEIAEHEFTRGGTKFPAGSWILASAGLDCTDARRRSAD